MSLTEQTLAQAMLLSGIAEPQQEEWLRVLCRCAVSALTARLRQGLTPEDCKAELVAAGALYALAALSETDSVSSLQRLEVGDVTMVSGGATAAASCLRKQAELMMAPFVQDSFSFRGV